MSQTRIEKDSLGEIEVPAGALYGAQTMRAVCSKNLRISVQAPPGGISVISNGSTVMTRLDTVTTVSPFRTHPPP